jgi:ribosomal protein S19E (S16A)
MARRQFSVHEKVWIIKKMYQLQYPVQVQRFWGKEMENNPPSRPTINALMRKFEETGSVIDITPPGRPVSVTGQNMMDEVSEILDEDRQTSTRRMSMQLNISQAVNYVSLSNTRF